MTEPQGDHTELLVGDAELLERVRSGDTAAYATLYERHIDAARGLARQLVRGDAEVDDVVAETFTRVFGVVQRGGGPVDGFRPYLLTAVRHAVYDRARGEKRQVVTDDIEKFDRGEPFVDPALEGLERSLIARAFLALRPEWQSVLWYTEIEGIKPAEAATILGKTPNNVAALAYRAREGLREKYLQMHLSGGAPAESCRPALGLLGAYVRGGLGKRDTTTVDRHLDACADCREVYAELMDVNFGLPGIILPLFAGPAAAGYLASLPGGALSGGWWGRMSKGRQAATAGAAATAVAAAAVLALVSNEEEIPTAPGQPPVAAAPPPQAPPPNTPEPHAPDPAAPDPEDPRPDPPDAEEPAPPAPAAPPGAPPAGSPADPPAEPAAPGAPPPGEPAAPGAPPPEAAAPDPPAVSPPPPREPGAPPIPPREPGDTPPPPSNPDVPPPPPPTPGAPEFSAEIDPVGALVPGRPGIIVISVRNLGADAGADVVAEVDLPSGVAVRGTARRGSAAPFAPGTDGWSCAATAEGAQCVRSGLDSGTSSTQYLDVLVSPAARAGAPPSLAVSAGDARTTATGSHGVDPGGQPARFAAAGQVRTESVGNALLTCEDEERKDRWPWWPVVLNRSADGAGPSVSPGPAAPEADERRVPAAPSDAPPIDLPPEVGDSAVDAATPDTEPSSDPSTSAPDTPSDAESGPEAPAQGPAEDEKAKEGKDEEEQAVEDMLTPPDEGDGACAQALRREGDLRDNDMWDMRPLDLDGDPGTTMSSSVRWSLPEGGGVRWAGLYFSGSGMSPRSATAKLRGPASDAYVEVRADEVGRARLPGYPVYQAFADITGIVRAQGGGEWWVADVPTKTGMGTYAGWSMVVVLEDPAAPYNQAMVLETTDSVFHDEEGLRFPLAGLLPAAVPATVDVVAWEGDADLVGDRVLLNGAALTPEGGDRDPDNAFSSSARGAVGPPLTFGTDVVRFTPTLPRDPQVRLVTQGDAFVAGVVAVTAPMRT
ncbi:RNA polymerase sigma factor (sigma-70 family) [Nocardiopsis mwathae]|uniref:RNA polymerase sigma factor (Sigma-70 family) n=1 Tax=Nocardiopsis mwathae TaxID=1472723 RepID=A0A7W9YN73_9ACTN|nr:sigma-70 family RNA polymerase sigma factor [Nocardiopsis mwathae]MBB6174631.1 RNA polymerase sigma factor (sigma-70 family) [Nocardiopsis mwathae]